MSLMPPTAAPTARKTRGPYRGTRRRRSGRGWVTWAPPAGRDRCRSASSPGRTGDRGFRYRKLSGGDGLAVEDGLDDRACVPGGALVVVEELPGILIGAVAAGPGDTRQLQAGPRQLVAGAPAHQEDRVARAGGQFPGRAERSRCSSSRMRASPSASRASTVDGTCSGGVPAACCSWSSWTVHSTSARPPRPSLVCVAGSAPRAAAPARPGP